MVKKIISWLDLCEETIKKSMDITNPTSNSKWLSKELNKKMTENKKKDYGKT